MIRKRSLSLFVIMAIATDCGVSQAQLNLPGPSGLQPVPEAPKISSSPRSDWAVKEERFPGRSDERPLANKNPGPFAQPPHSLIPSKQPFEFRTGIRSSTIPDGTVYQYQVGKFTRGGDADSADQSEADKLASAIREMPEDDPTRNGLIDELNKLLTEEFEERHASQLGDLERMEQRLNKLRVVHEERLKHKDLILQRRMDQLLGKGDVLGWTGPNNVGGVPSPSPRIISFPSFNGQLDSNVSPGPPLAGGATPQRKFFAENLEQRGDTGSDAGPYDKLRANGLKQDQTEIPQDRFAENRFTQYEAISRLLFEVSSRISELAPQLELLSKEKEQLTQLNKEGVLPIGELNRAQRDLTIAERQLQSSQKQFELIRKSIEIYKKGERSQQGIERLKQLEETYQELLETLDLEEDLAENDSEQAEQDVQVDQDE